MVVFAIKSLPQKRQITAFALISSWQYGHRLARHDLIARLSSTARLGFDKHIKKPINGLNNIDTRNVNKPLLPLFADMCAAIRLKSNQKNAIDNVFI